MFYKWATIFLLVLVFIGCAKMQKPMMTVVTGEPPETPTTPPESVEGKEPMPEVSFDNVLSLQVGEQYILRPSDVWSWEWPGDRRLDSIIRELVFGSLTSFEPVSLLPRLPADTPKVLAFFTLNPTPYAFTFDNERVIDVTAGDDSVIYDEIIIMIKRRTVQSERTSQGGRGRDPFTYQTVNYEAVAIENLTNPNRIFEYE